MTENPILAHYQEKKYEKISGGRRRGILELLGNFRDTSILDVGCANGALGKILKEIHPCTITGIDVSEHAGAEASAVLDQVYIFNTEDESAWPVELSGKVFDAITISEVLEHLFSPEQLLSHLRNYADQHARIVVTVPNILFWKNRLRIFFGAFEYEERGLMDRGHIHFFSWKSLVTLTESCGYRIIASAHHVPTRGTGLLAKWFPGLFAQTFIVLLKKV